MPVSEDMQWDMHVERALGGQQLSQSWSEVLREKQIAVEAALEEVRPLLSSFCAELPFRCID